MPAAEVIAILRANTTEFTAKMDEAEAKIAGISKAGGSSFEKMGKAAQLGGQVAAVAVLAIGAAAVDLAEKYNVAKGQLEAAAKGSGASFKSVQAQATAADGQMAHFGYTSTQVESATATLTIAQGKHVQVQKDLTLAADIAAARHIDLSSAINMVNKAAEGNTGALKRMGIDLPIAAGGALKVQAAQTALAAAQQKVNDILTKSPDAANPASKAYLSYKAAVEAVTADHQKLSDAQSAGTKTIDALTQRFGGQAAAAAQSMDGKLKSMKAQAENLGVSLGQKLIPILDKVVTAITKAVTWLEKHRAVAEVLGAVIGTILVAAIVAYTVAMVSAAAATIAAAWPILAIIAVVALLAAAVYEIIHHWGAIVDFFKGLWQDVLKGISTAWDTIVDFFKGIPGKIVTAVQALASLLYGWLKSVFIRIGQAELEGLSDILNFFGSLPGKIVNAVQALASLLYGWLKAAFLWLGKAELEGLADIITFFESLPGKILGVLSSAGQWLLDIGKKIIDGLWNGLKAAWNDVTSWLGGLGGIIKSIKGPIEYDATLLVPHGNAIMGGLALGLQQGFVGQVAPFLGGVAGQIAGTNFNAGISPIGGGAAAGGSSGGAVALNIDGATFARVVFPALQTYALQTQRGLSVPVFGTVQ